jgi:tetratricopeptide (TPR) repeat protein
LYFVLGNTMAAQGRWSEAEQAYAGALRGDESNPDYSFNLAVSLEWLHKPVLALQYYRRAAALAGSRPARFEARALQQRIDRLQLVAERAERASRVQPVETPSD